MPLGQYNHKRTPIADRLWANVEKTDGCWLWLGGLDPKGYGYISASGRQAGMLRTHRVAWRLATGEDPGEGRVCHTCDVRACVRNDDPGVYVVDGVAYRRVGHLFLATQRVNLRDMREKGRWEPPRGERVGVAKLTDEKVREIRALHAATGLTHKAIGQQFGVDASQITRVLTGERWKHV